VTRAIVVLAVLTACYRSSTTPPLRNQTPAVTGWRLGERGVGPIDAATKATELALQRLLPGLRVKTTNLGGESGIVFDVLDGTEKLMYVVPDDAPAPENAPEEFKAGYATTIFAIFATSSRVSVDGHPWRVGAALDSVEHVSVCECWGAGEVTACWTDGPHVRLIFEERCEDARDHGAGAMVGKAIGRIMWKRDPDPPPAVGLSEPVP
jgi:hypothetical protein